MISWMDIEFTITLTKLVTISLYDLSVWPPVGPDGEEGNTGDCV